MSKTKSKQQHASNSDRGWKPHRLGMNLRDHKGQVSGVVTITMFGGSVGHALKRLRAQIKEEFIGSGGMMPTVFAMPEVKETT
jgi:hypothetical protein